MALQQEVWVQDIIETLNKDASFTSRMRNLDQYVKANVLHYVNEGAAPVVYKNPTVFPLTPAQRIDTEFLTKLNQYVTQPALVTDLESAQLSYDKRQSVMGQHYRTLIETMGDGLFASLTPTDANHTYTIPTGKTLGYADMVKIAGKFSAANISQDKRHIELPQDMFDELLLDENIFKLYISGLSAVRDGESAVLRVAGINVHSRSTVATSGGKSAAFAYQSDAVGVCKGDIAVLVDSGDNGNGNPLYVGALANAVLWYTGVVLRPDGVIAVVRG